MKSYLLALRQKEGRIASKIQLEHGEDLLLVEEALEQILYAWNEFSSQKKRPEGGLESMRLFLATRSFNSLQTALSALKKGYWQQAAALVRMVMEDQLIAEVIEIDPPTLDSLLSGKGRLKLSEMARQLSPEVKSAWNYHYRILSEYASHNHKSGLQGLRDEQLTLVPGGHYDKVYIMTVLSHMLRELKNAMVTIAKVPYSNEIEWNDETWPMFFSIFEKIDSRFSEIDEWARNQVEEMD